MKLATIQKHLGIPADGIIGPQTLRAIGKALGIEESPVRRIGKEGLELIKSFEGLRLKAYRDLVGVWTIGYGSTGKHVKPGMVITEAQAEELLREDLARFEANIAAKAQNASQGQFDAIVSLAFNVGNGAINRSTLLRMHNVGNYEGAALQFRRWNRAGGRVIRGLSRRRAAEERLYRS